MSVKYVIKVLSVVSFKEEKDQMLDFLSEKKM